MEFKYSYYSNYTVRINGQEYCLYNAVIGPKISQPYLAYQTRVDSTLVNVWITPSVETTHPSLRIEANEYNSIQRNLTTTRQVTSTSD
jgi:hypothetical protein